MAGDSKVRKRLMDRKIVELLLQGKSQREVMKQLGVGDKRVKRVRSLAEQYGYLFRPGSPFPQPVALPPYPEALFPDGPDPRGMRSSEADGLLLSKKEWIVDRLRVGWHPISIFEEIGLSVGRSSFYRFLHRHGLYIVGETRRRVVPEIIWCSSGEALRWVPQSRFFSQGFERSQIDKPLATNLNGIDSFFLKIGTNHSGGDLKPRGCLLNTDFAFTGRCLRRESHWL